MDEEKPTDVWNRGDAAIEVSVILKQDKQPPEKLSHSIEEILKRPMCVRQERRQHRNWSVIKENDSQSNQHQLTGQRKSRQTRISFTPSQVEQLERVFRQSHYPDVSTREKLASHLHLTEGRIQVLQFPPTIKKTCMLGLIPLSVPLSKAMKRRTGAGPRVLQLPTAPIQ
ncbi:paired box protein Pax-3-A-like isoform X3 [Lampris incognitus]|uniref:paired box protein Pax-3-A-like isoform X3 n=1 Tax=Lampris incognitus TaxID=2546036 RepID=UPI0024B60047|nr:paired box protein Pax-3-A-like isoform X3 [Lampris incognitus]